MRVALNKVNQYCKIMLKTSNSSIEKPDSNIVVDASYFRQSGIISNLLNKMRNNNALFQVRRGVDKFSVSQFQKQTLEKYKQFYEFYKQRNYREIGSVLSESLLKNFKNQCKNKKKQAQLSLGWRFIEDVNQVKLVQVRVHQQKMSSLKVTDRWFQMTCKFSNPKGEQIFNLLQKHQKNKAFKFAKIDV